MTEEKESLDPHTSLFNCHVNKALEKVYAYLKKYEMEPQLKMLREWDAKGIMALPVGERDGALILGMVVGFVNSNRAIEPKAELKQWVITGSSGMWADHTQWAAGTLYGTERQAKEAAKRFQNVSSSRSYDELKQMDPNLQWVGTDPPTYSYHEVQDLTSKGE